MQFLGKIGNGPMNKGLNFGGSPVTVWIRGLFSGFVTIGRYGKWLTDINLLFKLICQMAALVRCALAEVCTVPVFVVIYCMKIKTCMQFLNVDGVHAVQIWK